MALRKISLTVGGTPIGKAVTYPYPVTDGKYYEIPTYELTVVGTDADGHRASRAFEVIRFGVHRKLEAEQPTIVGLADHQSYTIWKWLPTYSVHSARSIEVGAWQVHGDFLIHDGPDDPSGKHDYVYATAGCIEICGGPRGFDRFNELLIDLSGSTRPTRGEKLAAIGDAGILRITYKQAQRPPLKLWGAPSASR